MNILINAYAVAPNWGSEQGMSWNWIANIAKYNNVFVITEGEWQDQIEMALKDDAEDECQRNRYGLTKVQRDNIRFYYNPVTDEVRKMCWNQGDWRFYIHYEKWQKKTYEIAKNICSEYPIDVVHHLNMMGYREPGYLWKLDQPFVWGPIGGYSAMHLSFYKNSSKSTLLKLILKHYISYFQFTCSSRVKGAFKKASTIITTRQEMVDMIEKHHGKKAIIIPETGIKGKCIEATTKKDTTHFDLLWVGRFIETKKLDLAIRTIAALKDLDNLRLNIVGFGFNEEETRLKKLAQNLGVADKCIFHGKKGNEEVQLMMQQSDALFFTSIVEATSAVVLEAIQNRLPIICHNICGFGPIINDTIGRKIELETPEKSITGFSVIIRDLYAHREKLVAMKPNFDVKVEKLTYDYKAVTITDVYKKLCK